MSRIIGLSGFAGSGKDTAADALVDEGYMRIAFADVLRDIALAIDPYVLVPPGGFYRLKNVIEVYGWDEAKNGFDDVRRLLQRLGTEAGRNILGENVWVDTAFARADHDSLVVTDVRFPNELASIKERGGITVRIERPGVGPRNDHPSETSLVDAEFDYTVVNDSTIEELHQKMRRLA